MEVRSLFRIAKVFGSRCGLYSQLQNVATRKQLFKKCLPLLSLLSHRNYCEPARKYFMGKLIVEKVDDLFLHEYVLLTIQSFDEAVADSYLNFVQNAANMANINLTKTFNMPAIQTNFRIRNDPREKEPYKHDFSLKKYQRIAEFQNVTEEKCDILIEYLRESLPAGVDLKFELKRWEELVAPGHPSLKKEETPSYTGKS